MCDYDCEYKDGEYCHLLDDVVGYENCVFQKKEE